MEPYWFFIAGLVLILLFVLLAMPVRGPRRHYPRRLGPGGTRRLFGFGTGDYAEYFENPEGAPRFTMFGVDWCPHCVAAKPIFEALGSTVTIGDKAVALRYVNPEKEKEAAAGFQIDGYPTFVLEYKGQKTKYSGPRTADGIRQWLVQQLA